MNRYTLSAAVFCSAILAGGAAPSARQATTPPPQHQHQATDKPQPGAMEAKCKAMMAQHEKMMADMKAADARLDGLVAKMNAASGQAKVDATAAAVSEIVAQRKTMHESMMKMQHGMMGHMSEHAKAGPESMATCPMMKQMGGGH